LAWIRRSEMGTDIHGVFQKKSGDSWVDVPSDYDQGRHYLLFAWLGDVRNGFGFAGCQTHTPVVPLAPGRGFPEDFKVVDDDHPIDSLEIMDKSRREWHEDGEPLVVWMGDHSHSWVDGEEVLGANRPGIVRSGIVTKGFFDTWDGKSAPAQYCGGKTGQGVVVSNPEDITDSTTDVRITWKEDTTDSLAYFVDEVKRLVEAHGEVRFVFGFDS
jgi:hypothetical protein